MSNKESTLKTMNNKEFGRFLVLIVMRNKVMHKFIHEIVENTKKNSLHLIKTSTEKKRKSFNNSLNDLKEQLAKILNQYIDERSERLSNVFKKFFRGEAEAKVIEGSKENYHNNFSNTSSDQESQLIYETTLLIIKNIDSYDAAVDALNELLNKKNEADKKSRTQSDYIASVIEKLEGKISNASYVNEVNLNKIQQDVENKLNEFSDFFMEILRKKFRSITKEPYLKEFSVTYLKILKIEKEIKSLRSITYDNRTEAKNAYRDEYYFEDIKSDELEEIANSRIELSEDNLLKLRELNNEKEKLKEQLDKNTKQNITYVDVMLTKKLVMLLDELQGISFQRTQSTEGNIQTSIMLGSEKKTYYFTSNRDIKLLSQAFDLLSSDEKTKIQENITSDFQQDSEQKVEALSQNYSGAFFSTKDGKETGHKKAQFDEQVHYHGTDQKTQLKQ